MPDIAIDPAEIDKRRRERAYRLAARELPVLRVIGSVFLSIGVYLNNRYLVTSAPANGWMITTALLFSWAAVSWAALIYFMRRPKRRDLTPYTLAGDLVIWTIAIHESGAESSWLFFILLLRVADQTQTTFRRALAFAMAATFCYAGMLAWVVMIDGRLLAMEEALVKLASIFFAGIYIALAARTAESRRAQLTGAIRMSRDLINRLEEQSAELREAHARAEEASAAKSEFVANMSHEMRTPLQGVIGMLQLAIDEDPSEPRARRLESARGSAEILLTMIDDILDFSRIEARKLELEPVYFPLRRHMAETMKSLGVIAAARKLILSYVVQSDVPESVWGDPLRLRQVLVNLVGNAIKFTHEGEIAVYVSRAGEKVSFDVRDTGVGIAPDLRRRIFEPFTQADTSHSRRYGGTGLGLSIVARLLEVMQGSVDVASEQGEGSVFSFVVPLTADAVGASSQRRAWESQLAGRAVIIVERAEMSRAAIKEVLRSRGVFATACASVAEAPEGRFACAITDDPTIGVKPQVVITSPLEPTNDPVQISRPVAERELIDAVGIALGLTAQVVEYTLERTSSSSEPQRVLLVEDNDVNREVIAELLRRLGHLVSIASDGEEALVILARDPIDLVFMDVQLPGIDGLEVTRRFRERDRSTPVIALTAHSSREDRNRCLAAGMNEVLVKPVDAARLAAAITARTRAKSLLDVVGGNVALLARVREALARQTPELLSAIRAAVGDRDAEAVARHAHTLKGSLSHFPPVHGGALATELEAAAKAGDLDRAAALLLPIESALEGLTEALRREAGSGSEL